MGRLDELDLTQSLSKKQERKQLKPRGAVRRAYEEIIEFETSMEADGMLLLREVCDAIEQGMQRQGIPLPAAP